MGIAIIPNILTSKRSMRVTSPLGQHHKAFDDLSRSERMRASTICTCADQVECRSGQFGAGQQFVAGDGLRKAGETRRPILGDIADVEMQGSAFTFRH